MSEFLCPLVKISENSKGEKKIECISPFLRNIDKTDNSKLDDITLIEKTINNIKSISHCLGMFSSKLVDVCEFDNKPTNDLIVKILTDSLLFDAYPPYNNIWCDKKNEWKFDCLTKYYQLDKNILFMSDEFPKIINIKRSSGKIQKALVNETRAFSLYKTSKDNHKNLHLGLKIHFHNDKEYTEQCKPSTCGYSKIVLLEDIIELNPEIKNINFQFNLINPKKYSNMETIENKYIVENVITYFNNIYKNWLNNQIKDKLDEFQKITYNIEINE